MGQNYCKLEFRIRINLYQEGECWDPIPRQGNENKIYKLLKSRLDVYVDYYFISPAKFFKNNFDLEKQNKLQKSKN